MSIKTRYDDIGMKLEVSISLEAFIDKLNDMDRNSTMPSGNFDKLSLSQKENLLVEFGNFLSENAMFHPELTQFFVRKIDKNS